MNRPPLILLLFFIYTTAVAQYAPAAGQTGSTAMSKDSSAFVNWATGCRVKQGPQDISTPTLGFAYAGDSSMAVGKAELSTVSLGDGGSAVCSFQFPISNGPGPDFAVFENSFSDSFLELAFVEVSSDGMNFTRFRAHSLTDTTSQTGSFGATDPVKINNLAGKYRGGYGTPFDLQELSGAPGLDIMNITHVKIIDVIGNINKPYASYDGYSNKVNDPWPTPFPSGGFDLDAIGVIHQNAPLFVSQQFMNHSVDVFPNPLPRQLPLLIGGSEALQVEVLDEKGNIKKLLYSSQRVELNDLPAGIYYLKIKTESGTEVKKLVLQ